MSDMRVLKPFPAGFFQIPSGAIGWTTEAGQHVLDYMTQTSAAAAKDVPVDADALMVSADVGKGFEYVKAPPVGLKLLHDFAGTAVGANPNVVSVSPIVAAPPADIKPVVP